MVHFLFSVLFMFVLTLFTNQEAIAVDSASAGSASAGAFGLGLVVGETTGLSGKMFVSSQRAFDFHLGVYDSRFRGSVDYLHHVFNFLKKVPLDGYFGIGGRIEDWGHHGDGYHSKHDHDHGTAFGIRVPAGIRHMFSEVPVEVFGELALTLFLVPDTEIDPGISIGAHAARYR